MWICGFGILGSGFRVLGFRFRVWELGYWNDLFLEVQRSPLSSEFGTNTTANAKFWPWLEPFFRRKSSKPFQVAPCSLGRGTGIHTRGNPGANLK